MITLDDVLRHISDIKPKDAETLVSQINLLATQYGIGRSEILELLSKKPEELKKQISHIESRRTELKMDLRKTILEE